MTQKVIKVAVLLDSYKVGGSAKVVLQNLKHFPGYLSGIVILFERPESDLSEIKKRLDAQSTKYKVIKDKSFLDFSIFQQVYDLLKSERVDLIESNHYKTHLIALYVSKRLGIPWIAVSHGWTAENLKVRLYNILDRITLPWANACVASGPNIAEKLQSFISSKARVRCLPTAFDPEEHRSLAARDIKTEHSLSAGCFLFMTVARLSHEKGIDILIEAVNLLQFKNLNFYLIIIGSGPDFSKLKAKVSELKLESIIRFYSQITPEELDAIYRSVDGLVIPSRSEGLPNVLLEAAWFKVPVVSSNVGGIANMMGPKLSSFVIDQITPAKLASGMEDMIKLSKAERLAVGNELNQRLKESYLAEIRTKKVFRLYKSLVRKFYKT